MKTRNYTVAGHTFRLEMETNSPLWKSLATYTPFETTDDGALDETDTDHDGTNLIFTLRAMTEEAEEVCATTDESATAPEEELALIGNFDSEATRLTLFAIPDDGRLFVIAHHYTCHLHVSPDYRDATLTFPHDAAETNDAAADAKTNDAKTSPEGNAAETDPAAANPAAMEQLRAFALGNALMLLYAFATATHHTVLAHASVVMNGGTGKSTHTGLWLKHVPGSELLNDDNPVIRVENGIARVYGSQWSGPPPCYRDLGAPLGGIVRLSQAPRNQIARLQNVAAYATIIPSFSAMKWERHMADGIHDTVTRLIAATPVYHLQCLPDANAARLSAQTLQANTPAL